MQKYILSFTLGILLSFQFSVQVNYLLCFVGAVLWCLLICFRRRQLAWLLLSFCLGHFWLVSVLLQYAGIQQQVWSAARQDLFITGDIVSLVHQTSAYSQFLLVTEELCSAQHCQRLKSKLQLKWYGRQPLLAAGQRWHLQVKIKPTHGLANPGGFNRNVWQMQQGIHAQGYVKKSAANQLLQAAPFATRLIRLRQQLLEAIKQQVDNPAIAGIIIALTIGDKHDLPASQRQLFQATGTSHLLAISGLHIGLVGGFVFFLGQRLSRFSPCLLRRLPACKLAAIPTLLAVIYYAALAGFALPTERACIMIIVTLLALVSYAPLPLNQSLSVALGLVLLLNPVAVLDYGFWLSFGAVFLLLIGLQGRLKPTGWWWRWGRAHWLMFWGLMPLTLLFFQQVSLVSWFANVLAIPWVGWVIVPLCLLAAAVYPMVPSIATLLWGLAEWNLQGLQWLLAGLGQWPWATWSQAVPQAWVAIPACIAVCLLVLPRGFPGRGSAWCLLLPLFWLTPQRPPLGAVYFTLLDVGQGLAAVVETATHTLVYDTGPGFGDYYNSGERIILPYLRWRHIAQVDRLVVSHGDNDHRGGVVGLVANIPVLQISTSAPESLVGLPAEYCRQGEQWQWDEVSFEFLFPTPAYLGANNDASCVLRISAGEHRLLLPGDIERRAERDLLQHYPSPALQASILVAPHHGSQTSSTVAFVQQVKPDYVLFATGELNRYGFPHRQVVERYQQVGSQSYATADSGALLLRLVPGHAVLPPVQYRAQQQKVLLKSIEHFLTNRYR